MKGLPAADIYDQELKYMPYKASLKFVLDYICEHSPRQGTLLDMMCGTGYVLNKIHERRSDLALQGVDIDTRYISHAKENYPKIAFKLGDVLKWQSDEPFDVVICTGSLHHIEYDQQDAAFKNMASMMKPGGFLVISDCFVDDYADELERKTAAAKLGYEYLRKTIQNGAPHPVVEAAIDILWNDVLMKEYKMSLKKRLPIYEKYFSYIETTKTWPELDSQYGDYISICRKRQ